MLPWELGNTTFRSSSHTFSHSRPLISPHASPFCLFLRPSSTYPLLFIALVLVLSSQGSAAFCRLLLFLPIFPLSYFLPYTVHLFSPTHSSSSFTVPISHPFPHPSSIFSSPPRSALKESLIYSNKKRKNPFINSGRICIYLSLGCNNRWMTTVWRTVP